jgi:hypothetical protein
MVPAASHRHPIPANRTHFQLIARTGAIILPDSDFGENSTHAKRVRGNRGWLCKTSTPGSNPGGASSLSIRNSGLHIARLLELSSTSYFPAQNVLVHKRQIRGKG